MVTISLLTYNGARYLPACIAAVKDQTYRDWRLAVLDNGSHDESIAVMKELAAGDERITALPPEPENLGFAAGHNRIMQAVKTTYVLLLNQDVIMEPDYLEKMLAFAEKNPSTAAVAGLLLRWNPDGTFRLTDASKTRTIDSAGLRLHRSFRVTDRQSGEDTTADQKESHEVFGVSGACPLYRREALERIGWFDETFFSYKEDVDLAFRLRRAGYAARIVPTAVAYHHRGVGSNEILADTVMGKQHRARSFSNKLWSYRNHWYVLIKNVALADWLRYSLFIGWYEAKKFGWLLLFDQKVLWCAWRDIVGSLSRLLRERKKIKPRSVKQWIE